MDSVKASQQHHSNGEKAVVSHHNYERTPGRLDYKPYSDEELIAIADSRGFTDHSGLVVEPQEAERVFGKEVASNLKLNQHGNVVLYPQPFDDPNDPQNWSSGKKALMLAIVSAAAFVPDFVSSCGIASLFPLAAQYNTTTDKINNLTSNWSIFMLGWGGLIAIFLIKKLGRLPILFWSQLFGLGWTIGQAVAPNLGSFAAFRILAATFQTAPQVSGLFTVTDMYPFHLQARMVNLWTLAFVCSPFIGPSFLGFIIGAGITWRWVYGVACIYIGIVLFAIIFFMEETQYDRHLYPVPRRPSGGLRYRIETLIGITGWKMRKHRPSWFICVAETFMILYKPAVLLPLIYVLVVFGFGIGINVTNAVFVGSPPPVGYGLTPNQQAGSYFSPIVGCLIGEFIGRYMNDWIARRGTHRNHGVFEPEMRLWTLYFALPFYIAGFVLLGYCFEKKLNFAGTAIGWVIAEMAILMTTVCVYAYLNNVEPYLQGEVSALVNLFRVLGGFAVPFFQIEWAEKSGPHVVFGVEAACVAGLFIAIVPLLQWKGEAMRKAFPARRPAVGRA